jgi:hypothetical protein
MGFKVPNIKVTLKFASEEYEGLEIVVRKGTIADALRGEAMMKKAKDLSEAEGAQLVFEYLSEFIVSWNIEDDEGNPTPVNAASLMVFPASFAWDIFAAFIEQTTGVDSELGKDSDSTKRFQADLIPMETL